MQGLLDKITRLMKDRLINQELHKLTDLANRLSFEKPSMQPSYSSRVIAVNYQTPLESPRFEVAIDKLPLRESSPTFITGMSLPKNLGYSMSKETSPDIIKRIDIDRKPKISFFQPTSGDHKKPNFFTNKQSMRHSVRLPDGHFYEHRSPVRPDDRGQQRNSVTTQSHGQLPEAPLHHTSDQTNMIPDTFLHHERLTVQKQDSPIKGRHYLTTQLYLQDPGQLPDHLEEAFLNESRQNSSKRIELLEIPDLTTQKAEAEQASKDLSFDHPHTLLPDPFRPTIHTETAITQNIVIGTFKQFIDNRPQNVDAKKPSIKNPYMPLLGNLKPFQKTKVSKQDGEKVSPLNDPIAPTHLSPIMYKTSQIMPTSQPVVGSTSFNSVMNDIHRNRPSHAVSPIVAGIDFMKPGYLNNFNSANYQDIPRLLISEDALMFRSNGGLPETTQIRQVVRPSTHSLSIQHHNTLNPRTEGQPGLHRNSSVSHQPANRFTRPPISGGMARHEPLADMGILPMPGFDLLKKGHLEERQRSQTFTYPDTKSSGFLRSFTYHKDSSD